MCNCKLTRIRIGNARTQGLRLVRTMSRTWAEELQRLEAILLREAAVNADGAHAFEEQVFVDGVHVSLLLGEHQHRRRRLLQSAQQCGQPRLCLNVLHFLHQYKKREFYVQLTKLLCFLRPAKAFSRIRLLRTDAIIISFHEKESKYDLKNHVLVKLLQWHFMSTYFLFIHYLWDFEGHLGLKTVHIFIGLIGKKSSSMN